MQLTDLPISRNRKSFAIFNTLAPSLVFFSTGYLLLKHLKHENLAN